MRSGWRLPRESRAQRDFGRREHLLPVFRRDNRGQGVAEAELKPVSDSGTHGTTLLKGVGSTDVQVELEVSGLPTKDPDAACYAQVHEGYCSDERSDEGHEQEEHSSGAGPALALLRLEGLLAKGPILAKATGLQAHGGEEPGIPEVPSGSIEQPLSFGASSPDGNAFVSSLLEGGGPKRLMSWGPKYIHLHRVAPKGTPEELACGDLKVTRDSN
jgi:hypothetical protein